jgi:hypothetical protein
MPEITSAALDRRTILRAGVITGVGAILTAGTLSGNAAAGGAISAAFATQDGWRWCGKCQGFGYGPTAGSSRCAGGGQHTTAGSFAYLVWYSDDPPGAQMQSGWRWCNRCQSLAYGGAGAGWCSAGGHHDHTGSFNYHMWHDVGSLFPGEQDQWRWCRKCQNLFYGPAQGSSWCSQSGRHDSTGSFNYMIQYDSGLTATAARRRPGK